MEKKGKIERVNKLVKTDYELGAFPYEDCKKIYELVDSHEWDMIPDLNTFFSSLWSLSAVEKLLALPLEKLENYKQWLEKSFFERFPKYLQAKELITSDLTPVLYKQLEVNEELRELLLNLVVEEIDLRKS